MSERRSDAVVWTSTARRPEQNSRNAREEMRTGLAMVHFHETRRTCAPWNYYCCLVSVATRIAVSELGCDWAGPALRQEVLTSVVAANVAALPIVMVPKLF